MEPDSVPVEEASASYSVELDDLDKTLEEAEYALNHPEEFKSFKSAKAFLEELSRE